MYTFASKQKFPAQILRPLVGRADWHPAVAALSRRCRGAVAALSRRCRGAVAALSRRCRGAVAALSRRCRGAVATLSRRCRGAVAALSRRCRGAALSRRCAIAVLSRRCRGAVVALSPHLHVRADVVAVGEDLRERLRAEQVAQRRLREEARRLRRVLDVDDRHHRVLDAVVDDGIHRHRHRVLREDLRRARWEDGVGNFLSRLTIEINRKTIYGYGGERARF